MKNPTFMLTHEKYDRNVLSMCCRKISQKSTAQIHLQTHLIQTNIQLPTREKNCKDSRDLFANIN